MDRGEKINGVSISGGQDRGFGSRWPRGAVLMKGPVMNNDDSRTLYTIIDEVGQNSTITLDKFVADILQENLSDVHAWVQSTYNTVAKRKPHLGRWQKGDLVRALSIREAVNYLQASGALDDF